MDSFTNVRVYNVVDQHSGNLRNITARYGLDHESLGGYISIIIATHLSMCKAPSTAIELEELVKQVTLSCVSTLGESCARMIAMIKERRLTYYKEHRREFIPESLEQDAIRSSSNSNSSSSSSSKKAMGKYSDRLSLSKYMSAPMSEADMTYALNHIIGFASNNISLLRTIKSSNAIPTCFTIPTSTGFKGSEESRAAWIQQQAYSNSGYNVFIETNKIREYKDYSIHGIRGGGCSNGSGSGAGAGVNNMNADGSISSHEAGIGLTTQCYALHTYLKGLDFNGGSGSGTNIISISTCKPIIIDVSNSNSTTGVESLSDNIVYKKGHHVTGVPMIIEGRRILIIFDSLYRKSSYKSQGLLYSNEEHLSNCFQDIQPLVTPYTEILQTQDLINNFLSNSASTTQELGLELGLTSPEGSPGQSQLQVQAQAQAQLQQLQQSQIQSQMQIQQYPRDDTVNMKHFSARRCKLCGVIHSSDMHAEFQ